MKRKPPGTRSPRRAAGACGRPLRRPARGRPLPGRAVWLILAVLLLGAGSAWVVLHRRAGTTRAPEPALPIPVLLDSVNAAEEERDWPRACFWFQRLVDADPGNPTALLGLGLAWHNRGWTGPRHGPERSATRTSLERIAMNLRALALMDSAARLPGTPEEWASARTWHGQTYETLGLPLDALQDYAEISRRQPGYEPVRGRLAWVLQSLRDPLKRPTGAQASPPDEESR